MDISPEATLVCAIHTANEVTLV